MYLVSLTDFLYINPVTHVLTFMLVTAFGTELPTVPLKEYIY